MVKNKTVEITKFINNDFTREDLEKLSEEMKMVPLTYDFSFKRVFNWKLDLLADFLISVLELNHINPKYCELKWLPNEMPKENKKEYKKTLDIYVSLNENIHIGVEVNREAFNDIKLRNQMFADKAYTMLLKTGQHFRLLNEKEFYQLNLNAIEKQTYIGDDEIVPYGIKTGRVYNDNKKIILKYLAYYRKKFYNGDIDKKADIWLAALTAETFIELYDILSYILPPKERDDFVREVITMSNENFILHEWEKEQLDALVEDEKKRRLIQEGIEQGLEQGLEQGSKQEKLEIAKNMLVEKINIETISKVTNLSKAEIEKLK